MKWLKSFTGRYTFAMCGRYVIKNGNRVWVQQNTEKIHPDPFRFIDREIDFGGTYNAAPTQQLLKPYPPDEMAAVPVSTRVNSVRNDGLELLEPLNRSS